MYHACAIDIHGDKKQVLEFAICSMSFRQKVLENIEQVGFFGRVISGRDLMSDKNFNDARNDKYLTSSASPQCAKKNKIDYAALQECFSSQKVSL